MMVVAARCNTQQPRQRIPKRQLSGAARLTTTIRATGRGNPPKIHCRIGSGTCCTSELGPKLARRSSNSISSSSSSSSPGVVVVVVV